MAAVDRGYVDLLDYRCSCSGSVLKSSAIFFSLFLSPSLYHDNSYFPLRHIGNRFPCTTTEKKRNLWTGSSNFLALVSIDRYFLHGLSNWYGWVNVIGIWSDKWSYFFFFFFKWYIPVVDFYIRIERKNFFILIMEICKRFFGIIV